MPALHQSPSSPSAQPSSPQVKRKRADLDPHSLLSDACGNSNNDRHSGHKKSDQTIHDIWDVLQSRDPASSVFDHVPTKSSRHTDLREPSAKRAKRSNTPNADSIRSKVQHCTYTSLEQFVADVEEACSHVLQSTQPKGSGVTTGTQWRYVSDTVEQDRIIANVIAFRKLFRSLVARGAQSLLSEPAINSFVGSGEVKMEASCNGTAHEEKTSIANQITEEGRTVLTLFGNAQGHKQLFSSFQKPLSRSPVGRENVKEEFQLKSNVEPILPIRENGLPNGISSTKIMPIEAERTQTANVRASTFVDVFAPPRSIPVTIPPKTPQTATVPSSNITWTQLGISKDSMRTNDYTKEKHPAGHWLGYDGLSPVEEPSSPEAKRKRRDRALSVGEASMVTSERARVAQMQAKEEALFRSAYSSFAPCRDDADAIVPEQLKSEVWWHRTGHNLFDQAFGLDSPVFERNDETSDIHQFEDEETLFREAVETFTPSNAPEEIEVAGMEAREKAAGTILREVSNMLETLHSYQRIRNSSISGNGRAGIGQTSSLQDLVGTPSAPSNAEVETYKSLKAHLATTISALPPYAAAKVGGQQLSDLNVSSHILVDGYDYRGVMEEDQASRLAKAAALNAAVGVSASARAAAALTSSQYSVPQPRTAQMTQPARASAPQYSQSHQPLTRQSSNFSRQPLSSWQSPAQAYQNNSQRPVYAQQSSYGQTSQQATKPAYPSTAAPFSQYLPPRPSSLQQNKVNYQSPSQPQYQQRAQSYGNYSTKPPYTTSGSPSKPAAFSDATRHAQYGTQSTLSNTSYASPPLTATQQPLQTQQRSTYAPTPTPPLPHTSTSPYPPNNPYPPTAISSQVTMNGGINRATNGATPPISNPQPLQPGVLGARGDPPQPLTDMSRAKLAAQEVVTRSLTGTPQL